MICPRTNQPCFIFDCNRGCKWNLVKVVAASSTDPRIKTFRDIDVLNYFKKLLDDSLAADPNGRLNETDIKFAYEQTKYYFKIY